MKIFLQGLWEKGLEWDDPFDANDKRSWRQLTENLHKLSDIQIPRYIGNEQSQLIAFCDASKKAYAAAIYLRTVINGEVNVNLIFSKARVAPKQKKATKTKSEKKRKGQKKEKETSIPKLELRQHSLEQEFYDLWLRNLDSKTK